MSKDFSVDSLKEFVQDYLDGKLEPHIKLEPVPILIILDPLSKNEFAHACNENYCRVSDGEQVHVHVHSRVS